MRDVARELTASRETAGLHRDVARVVWRVDGARALDALQGLLTNDLRSPAAGSAIPCLALTPKGRPLADLKVWKGPADAGPLLLDLPALAADALLAHFGRYLPPRFASVEPVPEAGVFELLGPETTGVLLEVFGPDLALPDVGRCIAVGGSGSPTAAADRGGSDPLLTRRSEDRGGGWEIVVLDRTREVGQTLLEAVEFHGGCALGAEAWEIWRVEWGIPLYGRDFGLDNLPQETGLTERTVSFDKGCYTGQEVVARIHYRGHVNQRLIGLVASGDQVLPASAELFRDGRAAGRVTSPVQSPRFGSIALGMIRREVEPGALLAASPAEEPTIRVTDLPFTS